MGTGGRESGREKVVIAMKGSRWRAKRVESEEREVDIERRGDRHG